MSDVDGINYPWESANMAGFMAERRRVRASTYPLSSGVAGSELYEWMTNGISSAGMAVNERTARCVSAVHACISLISGAISTLPQHIYERTDEGRKRAQHDYWWLLNEQPHPVWTSATAKEYLLASVLLHGDGFWRIIRASPFSPVVAGFEPIHPLMVQVLREGGRLVYVVRPVDGAPVVIDQDDMIHVPGVGFDGLRGMSPLRHWLKTPAGIALAADDYSGKFFANGARPDFAIEVPGTVTAEQQAMIRESWAKRHGGSANAHLPALMTGGAKVHELTMNAEDAQLIATRQFQVEDIARIFGVPPHMIGHTEKTTSWGSGVEAMGIGFVKYTLAPHLVKLEQEFNRKLFRTAKYFSEFATAGLERGDIKTRSESYRIAIGRAGEPGWMTQNEIRKLENLPPVDGGDDLNQGGTNAPQQPAAAAG